MTAHLAPALAAMLEDIPSHPDAPCVTGEWLGHSDFAVERRKAAARCAACPILWECHEGATDRGERWGVWGGEDLESTYRREHTNPTPRKRQAAKCGTDSGYKAHQRVHQPACEPCKQAHAIAASERREALREARQAS